MLSRCKAHLQRDAKMRALGLTLRDESQKGQGVYYDGTGGLSRGQELGNLLDHAHAINRAEHAALVRRQSCKQLVCSKNVPVTIFRNM